LQRVAFCLPLHHSEQAALTHCCNAISRGKEPKSDWQLGSRVGWCKFCLAKYDSRLGWSIYRFGCGSNGIIRMRRSSTPALSGNILE
jgi:hypothetical protein